MRGVHPEPLPADLAAALDSRRGRLGRIGSPVLFFARTGSTNDVATALAGDGDPEGAVVVADEQTAGRGRCGRAWFSPPASGLYVSVVLTPAKASDRDRATTLLTLAAGVALAEGLETATGLGLEIKWPNDLGVGRRKLAGILAEASAGGSASEAVVLGYGVNIAPAAYPGDLAARASSLETELGRRVDRAAIFGETLAALARRYEDLLAGRFDAILDAWRGRAPASCGTRVTWQDASGPRVGVTAGIDDRGALLIQAGDRLERFVAGELTWS